MSSTQRLALLGAAAIIAVLAIVVLPSSDDDNDPSPAVSTQAAKPTSPQSGAETPDTATTPPAPKPQPPLLRAGAERELKFTSGETVRFRVRHPSAEEVHVHGYDISRDLQPGKTQTIAFKATLEGIFEIELEHSGTPLASLKVEPK